MTDRLADTLLSLATRIAPPERRPWLEAVRAEADQIAEPIAARRWAVGGLLAALGWTLRRDVVFLALLLATGCYGVLWVQSIWIDMAKVHGAAFIDVAILSQRVCLFLPSLVFALWRPDRALLTFVVMGYFEWKTLLWEVSTDPQRYSPLWSYELSGWFGPVIVGTVLGALAGQGFRAWARVG
jgi:hypothetical protein